MFQSSLLFVIVPYFTTLGSCPHILQFFFQTTQILWVRHLPPLSAADSVIPMSFIGVGYFSLQT